MKKAFTWLDQKSIPYRFHDYKKEGITATKLKEWCRQVGWEILLNKKGQTWRNLGPEVQATIKTQQQAIAAMAAQPSMIKRPVLEKDGEVIQTGFSVPEYEQRLQG